MADFRVESGFFRHVKTKKLKRALGWDGVIALQMLWAYAAEHKHGAGKIYSSEDIELAVDWEDEDGDLVSTLESIGFLDQAENGFIIHEWDIHNGYAATAEKRSEAARIAVKTRWAKEKDTPVLSEPIRNDTISNTEPIRNDTISNTEPIRNDTISNTEPIRNDTISNTPYPLPSPYPLPIPLPILKDSCPAVPESALTELVPNSEIVMSIPLNAKDKFFHVTEHDIDQWQETFPGVDVLAELRVCRQWNIDNPKNRKTWNGIRTHISSWLGRSQDKYSSRASPQRPRAMTVRDALTLQSDEIARVLNDDHRNKQQRVDIEHGQKSGLLVEH